MPLRLRTFHTDSRGTVALLFGLVAFVLVGLVGAAFDYSRLALVQTNLQRAVDAAVLLAVRNRQTLEGNPMPDVLAAQYLRNTFDVDQLTNLTVRMKLGDDRVRLEATGDLKMTISNVIGFRTAPVKGIAEALYGDTKVELVLVLDNTASMAQLNKLEVLKKAAKRFVTRLGTGGGAPDAIKIAIVPFDTNVNLGSLKDSSWVATSAAAAWADDPSRSGCIWDREQPHDALDTKPAGSTTQFTADTTRSGPCSLAPILPLTTNFGAMHSLIDGMVASGNTNTTIGLAWGLHVLSSSEPVTGGSPPGTRGVQKYIVFMTDGNNTQNRWSKSQTEIDSRTRRVCETIQASKIQVFTARIIEGNESLLKECATASDMYYDVQDVEQLEPVFNKIYAQIIGTRIAR